MTSENNMNVGFLGLLALLFIGLKLGGVIEWSWWWVLAPIWAPWGLFGIALFLFGIIFLVDERRTKKKLRRMQS